MCWSSAGAACSARRGCARASRGWRTPAAGSRATPRRWSARRRARSWPPRSRRGGGRPPRAGSRRRGRRRPARRDGRATRGRRAGPSALLGAAGRAASARSPSRSRRPWRPAWSPPARLARAGLLRARRPATREIPRLREALEGLGARFDGRLRVTAVDRASGRRVVFGAPGAPEADVVDAVLASCAVPWMFRPVEIGGRTYVDGGVWSAANLDAAPVRRGSVVLCLLPTATPRLAVRPARGDARLLARDGPLGDAGPQAPRRGGADGRARRRQRRGDRAEPVRRRPPPGGVGRGLRAGPRARGG